MRFLFVYQDFAARAQNLLERLGVADVQIIVARKGEVVPSREEIRLLEEYPGAEAAACQLDRKYRRNVVQYVRFTIEPKKFRFDDQTLRSWLVRHTRPSIDTLSPYESFRRSQVDSKSLLLHQDSLEFADDLHVTRWQFVAKSATLLTQCASGAELGPMREWWPRHGVKFASSGQVSYTYSFMLGGLPFVGESRWHLKAGDNTSADRAARIYFERVDTPNGPIILVFYVGPHPTNGCYPTDFGSVSLEC